MLIQVILGQGGDVMAPCLLRANQEVPRRAEILVGRLGLQRCPSALVMLSNVALTFVRQIGMKGLKHVDYPWGWQA